MLTDDEIIEVRKATRVTDFNKPWPDTLAFARAIEARVQPRISELEEALRHIINSANDPASGDADEADFLRWIARKVLSGSAQMTPEEFYVKRALAKTMQEKLAVAKEYVKTNGLVPNGFVIGALVPRKKR